jgi:methylphosphotriester-DNA--protein-cysteine methyltransferase
MCLASKQLKQSSLSTGEIAETVGYLSEAAFQRAFKQHMKDDSGAVATNSSFDKLALLLVPKAPRFLSTQPRV